MTTDQKLTPAQSESPLTSDDVRKGINITAGGHRREQRRRRCLLNLLLVAATIMCINAAVTTLLISWRTPTVVSFDMKKRWISSQNRPALSHWMRLRLRLLPNDL